jgi:hypothetical protein
MNITKKIRCLHCKTIIENNGVCVCGKVRLTNGVITEGSLGKDFVDISAVLLNETSFNF